MRDACPLYLYLNAARASRYTVYRLLVGRLSRGYEGDERTKAPTFLNGWARTDGWRDERSASLLLGSWLLLLLE